MLKHHQSFHCDLLEHHQMLLLTSQILSLHQSLVMTLGHNTSHSLSRRVVSFLSFLSPWLHHQSADGIATNTSSLCFLLILLSLLLWSLCYSPTKLMYINRYDMFVVLELCNKDLLHNHHHRLITAPSDPELPHRLTSP